jgi:hypothetical protein
LISIHRYFVRTKLLKLKSPWSVNATANVNTIMNPRTSRVYLTVLLRVNHSTNLISLNTFLKKFKTTICNYI